VRAGKLSAGTAYIHATNPGNLRVTLADVHDDGSLTIR